jgi:hypothetical protein
MRWHWASRRELIIGSPKKQARAFTQIHRTTGTLKLDNEVFQKCIEISLP